MRSHLKRLKAPKTWKIARKVGKYITRAKPSGYKSELCMPLVVILRDIIKCAKTAKEVKNILQHQEVNVDNTRTKDYRLGVGLMSVISMPKIKKSYRMILNKKGSLELIDIKEEESKLKICKITSKKARKKGFQIGLFDGRTLIVEKNDLKVGDSLLIEVPSQSIKKHLKFEADALAYLIVGKHKGSSAIIESIEGTKVLCKTQAGDKFETTRKHAIIIGKGKSEITVEK